MIEQQIQRGQQWLEQLLELIGIPAKVRIENAPANFSDVTKASRTDSQPCWLTIDETTLTSSETEIVIGENGENIDAIQYLANTLLNIGVTSEEQRAFTVELNGYRVQRQIELLGYAEKVAQKVRETGQEVEMKSLSSSERRQIHTFLKGSGIWQLKVEVKNQIEDLWFACAEK